MRIARANPQEASRIKRQLLTQEEPSHVTGIAEAYVIKDAGLFFLCGADGTVPHREGHGLGLYSRDCRVLSGYELRVAETSLESLAANDEDGFRAVFQLTNPQIGPIEGGIGRQRIGVRWRHAIDAEHESLHDEIILENYDTRPYAFPLSLSFSADFRDVFVIRGLIEDEPRPRPLPTWEADELVFAYVGRDRRRRELRITFSEPPSRASGGEVTFDVQLEPHEAQRIVVSLVVVEKDLEEPGAGAPVRRHVATRDGMSGVENAFAGSLDEWMKGFTRVRSTSLWVERAVNRSLRDLRALRMKVDEHSFIAAGVPWFTTLFGRDSLICALQTLAYRPAIAAETLRLLARFQGTQVDRWRDEEPGKILHELRDGELARAGEIPYAPYYGTVDATPLFLILVSEYVRWAGDLSLFRELRAPIEAALRWIDEFGDHDGDGYLDYQAEAGEQLINQGWKDSGGAIVDARGRRAEAPIALCEVQGYVYRAKEGLAELFSRSGEVERARTLRREAAELRARFNRDFWIEEAGFYALALERGGRRVDAITSNAGQALWTGIVDDRRVGQIVDRLMAEDMYTGWGIRTLSNRERAYNPVGYHLGTVWPHDNSIIGAGFRRYARDEEASRILLDLIQASTYFPSSRLPETFAGFSRDEYAAPVRYPVACHPQAWSSGSIPFLLSVLLGLEPDALERRLRVVRPCLPPAIDRISLEHLRVGAAEVDLLFVRAPSGGLDITVERLDGDLDVQIAP